MKKGNTIIAIIIILLIIVAGITIPLKIVEINTSIKYEEITLMNYDTIYEQVNRSSEISLQEKTNFNKNYLLFGKKIIGYRVKDIIKKIEI